MPVRIRAGRHFAGIEPTRSDQLAIYFKDTRLGGSCFPEGLFQNEWMAASKMNLLRIAPIIAILTLNAIAASADSPALSRQLAPLSFILGDWNGSGKIENGGTAKGVSSIHPVLGGAGILRRDRTDLFAADGKSIGGYDQMMLIYPEAGTLHADFLDGQHVIHYVRVEMIPNQTVTFATAEGTGAPVFHLTYSKTDANTVHIKFEMAPPGQSAFKTIAEGDVQRAS